MSLVRPSLLGAFALATLAVLELPAPARAQLTPEQFVSSDVDALGPEKPLIVEGLTRFSNRDFSTAREKLAAAVQRNPKLAPPDVLMARAFLIFNESAAARSFLEQAIKQSPNDPEAYLLLGRIANSEGRSTEAELLLQKAMSLTGTFDQNARRKRNFLLAGYATLAEIAEKREQWPQAKQYLTQLVSPSLEPDNGKLYQALARAQFKLGDAKGAYETLKKGQEKDSKLSHPGITMASFYAGNDNPADSAKWIQFAVGQLPSDQEGKVNTYVAAAQLWLTLGDAKKALTMANAALQLDPKSFEALLLRGIAAQLTGDDAAAEAAFEAAHALSPTNFNAINQMALLLAEQPSADVRKRALDFATLNARIYPLQANQITRQSIEAAATLAWVLTKLNRINEADQTLRPILPMVGNSPDASFLAAQMLLDQGRSEQAISLLQGAVDSKGLFLKRADAKKLLEGLKKPG